MSKNWLSRTKVWAERNNLIIAGIIVVAVCGLGLLYARANCVGWAQVLVLGITALVVVWYAHEARRLATSTEALAESTRRMASGAWRPNVVLSAEHEPHLSGHRDRIFNYGPGPAHELWIVANHPDSPELLSHHVPPEQPVHIPDQAKDLLKWPVGKEQHISLFWLDAMGQEYALKWHYARSHWIPDDDPPSRDWDVWRKVLEHLNRQQTDREQ